MPEKWICIEVECEGKAADELGAELAERYGVPIEFTDRGIRFYLEDDRFSKIGKSGVLEVLSSFRDSLYPGTSFPCAMTVLPDEDWTANWKAHFKPLRVGRRFLICPTWEDAAPCAHDRVLSIDPGRAFGTGHHETTALCLRWLEEWAEERDVAELGTLLDLGTGSGILAMAAVLLGYREVVGLDNDPEAIEVAEENVVLNGLQGKMTLRTGSVTGIDGCFDIVVANIQSQPLVEMAREIAKRVKPRGRAVLSGILLDQQAAVRDAYEGSGMIPAGSKTAGEWCLLEFKKS